MISSVAATIAGAITIIANFGQFTAMFGGGQDEEEENGGLGAIGMLLMMVIAPLAAAVIQMAISRAREFGAAHAVASIRNYIQL